MEIKEIHVSEPWFTYIKNNKKRIEGRLNKGSFSELKKKQIIRFFNKDLNEKFDAKIVNIVKYKSFEEYLTQEGLKRTLPNINTIQDGVSIYRQYYSLDDENRFGILAIYVKRI